jgi:oligosaccharide repeat unit polymerase
VSSATFAALIASIALIAWAAAMRALAGTWLNPSAFFAIWWCFAGILPLILAPREPVGVNAIVWLVAASIAFSVGALIGNWGFKTRRIANPPPPTDRELVVYGAICLVSVILGIGSNAAFIAGTPGINYADLFDIEKLVVVANQNYLARYDEMAPATPALSQMLLPFVYLAPLAGGALFVLHPRYKWRFLGIVSFLPSVAVTLLQTTKAAMLFAFVLWLSSYFSARLRKGKLAVFTKKHLAIAIGVGGTVTALFIGVSLARMASTDLALLNVVYLKLTTAALGHMSVFSQYLTSYLDAPFSPTLGKVTFGGPLEMLGYGRRLPGLFDTFIELVAGETTNIYTGFRPLIDDFTIAGALIVLALVGMIGGVGFRLVAAGRWSAVPLLIISYLTIFWTPFTWFWIYNSLTATVVAVGVMVWLVRVWRGVRYPVPAT